MSVKLASKRVFLLAMMLIATEAARSERKNGDVVIKVSDDPVDYWLNFALRTIVFSAYFFLLSWTIYNIVQYLFRKQRYKEFAIILYYTFFVALFVSRLIQTVFQYTYINDRQVKNCILASDGFSVAIGITQVALIGDLVISLQCFEQQVQVCDRETVTAAVMPDHELSRYTAIDRRTALKRKLLVVITTIAIAGCLTEIIVRFFIGYSYPLLILYGELVVIGVCLAVETNMFLRLSRRIFEGEFQDEQRFFKVSLAVFLSTYGMRCIFLMLIIFFFNIYEGWFENMPFFAATVQCACHMAYDCLPVVHIMLRHRKIFDGEEKSTTMVVMS